MTEINTASGVPIWRQIADAITDDIAAGRLAVGDRVPSTRDLSDQWGVAMTTTVSALAELRRQGLIMTTRGRGSYVATRPTLIRKTSGRYRHGDDIGPTQNDFARQAVELHGVGSVTDASPAVAHRLHIRPGDPVSRIDYLWTDERGPIQRSTQYEPLALTDGTSAELPPESGYPDVITRFDQIGHHATRVAENLHSRMPTAAESSELKIGEGIPVFFIERTHYASKTPIETADITLRGDRVVITTEHHVAKGPHQ